MASANEKQEETIDFFYENQKATIAFLGQK